MGKAVNHPQELLAIGQRLDVYVISVDRDNRRWMAEL
jgi:ribosomal protein S1